MLDKAQQDIQSWDGLRRAVGMDALMTARAYTKNGLNDMDKVSLSYDSSGKVQGILTYKIRESRGYVQVNYVATRGDIRGVGRDLMRQAIKTAAARGLEVRLKALPESEAFYRKLGFNYMKPSSSSMSGENFRLTAKQVAAFSF